MSRTTATLLLVTMIILLVVGVVGFVMIGQQAIELPSITMAAPRVSTIEPSSVPDPEAGHLALSTWEPHPTSTLALKVLTYSHFTVGYDEQAKNPAWVAYELAGPITSHGHEQRPSTFATEFRTSAHVSHRDYSSSGFDRGHMCPAYAMFSRFGDDGMRSTFIMSNVIPQYHGLNAGEWEQLETMIAGREGNGDGWAASCGSVWVINGPIYGERPAAGILKNGTWIPTACFSVVLRKKVGAWDALAFEMPNEKNVAGPVSRYLVTITTINRDTKLDLLEGMPTDDKSRLEQMRAMELWR